MLSAIDSGSVRNLESINQSSKKFFCLGVVLFLVVACEWWEKNSMFFLGKPTEIQTVKPSFLKSFTEESTSDAFKQNNYRVVLMLINSINS
jgi:hypothetical protein